MSSNPAKTDQNRPFTQDRVDAPTMSTVEKKASPVRAPAVRGFGGTWGKADEDDLVWFFNYAEGELAPNYSFSVFEWQCALGHCDLGVTNFSEPDDTKMRAASRSRRVGEILDALPRRTLRILQRSTAFERYLPESVRVVFGRVGLIAMLLEGWNAEGGDRALVAACDVLRGMEHENVTRIERRPMKVKLDAIGKAAEEALRLARDAYAKERTRYDATHKSAPERRFDHLLGILRGGR